MLYGGEDPGVRREFLDGYEEHADDLTVVEVPGAAHFVPEDRPDFVAERSLAFFAAH